MAKPSATTQAHTSVFQDFQQHCTETRLYSEVAIVSALRARYPNFTVEVTPSSTNLIEFAEAGLAEATLDLSTDELFEIRACAPASDPFSRGIGKLESEIVFGKYDYKWNTESFIVYKAQWGKYYDTVQMSFILHENDLAATSSGRSKASDDLIMAASQYASELHDEILVFDQEKWTKNRELWTSVQHSSWDDVILNPVLKHKLLTEVESFFDCRDMYHDFSVPWKVRPLVQILLGTLC